MWALGAAVVIREHGIVNARGPWDLNRACNHANSYCDVSKAYGMRPCTWQALRCGSNCCPAITGPVAYRMRPLLRRPDASHARWCVQRAACPCNVAEGHRLLTGEITECVPAEESRVQHAARMHVFVSLLLHVPSSPIGRPA